MRIQLILFSGQPYLFLLGTIYLPRSLTMPPFSGCPNLEFLQEERSRDGYLPYALYVLQTTPTCLQQPGPLQGTDGAVVHNH